MIRVLVGVTAIKGGAGSGNFGHRGRPGHRGGSSSTGGAKQDDPKRDLDRRSGIQEHDARHVFVKRTPASLSDREWDSLFAYARKKQEAGETDNALGFVARALKRNGHSLRNIPQKYVTQNSISAASSPAKQRGKKKPTEEVKKEPPGKPEKPQIEKWKKIGQTITYSGDPAIDHDLAEFFPEVREALDPGKAVFWVTIKGGPGSGNFGHAGRPGEIGGSSRFDVSLSNDEIEAVRERIPEAIPISVILTAEQIKKYKQQYEFWEEQGSSDWDRVARLEKQKHFAPLVVGGTPARWWILDGSHRLAILAKHGLTSAVVYFDNASVYAGSVKGGAGSGNFDHAGRPGERGGSARSGAHRIWQGKQHEASTKLSKLDTGAIGERIATNVLSKLMGVPFDTVNKGVNNAPFDVAGDSTAVEVKTGLATNGDTAHHWRATIGQPGKEEAALLKQMSAEEKRAHNAWKSQQILERKQALLAKMEEEAGKKIRPVTMGIILSGDGKAGDVFMIPGFHLRLPWNKYATEEYYVGTYDLDQNRLKG